MQDDQWWDESVVPYLIKARAKLHKSLVLLADVHINPTAARPLSGLDAITGEASGIVPHTKAEMRTVATPHHSLPKIMITTGAATEANYSDSKAGAKGKFHHILGALVVEIDKDAFHLRRINAGRDGSFIDLATEYGGRRVKKAPSASALVLGDIHVGFEDEGVRKATFEGEGSLVQLLRPRHIVWHDVLDFRSHMHWDEKKPFVQLAKAKAGKTNVLAELKEACDFISRADGKCGWKPLHIFPFANHPDAFMRWMERTDWRDDLENAELYLETALEMARWAEWGEHGAEIVDPFVFWAKKHMRATLLARCVFLGPNDSFMLEGVEVGMHGHLGPNGARGSLANLSTLGVKSITGHVHSPGERDGAISVGTSSRLFMGYNLGPSSWLNSHCCLQEGGKRQMINVIKGRAYLR